MPSNPIDPHLPPHYEPVRIYRPEDMNDLENGDVVQAWDYLFQWDKHCRTAAQLETWRQIPDSLMDEYLATVSPEKFNPSHDQLQLLLTSETPEANALLASITAQPPIGVRATDEEIRLAQECFYRFAGGILLGTFYVSLVGGFSSPRISSVLHQTSYLVAPTVKNRSLAHATTADGEDSNDVAYAPITPQVRERTSVRLMETLQFVLDIMGSPLPIASVDAAQGDVERPSDYESLNASRLGPACLRPLTGEGWKSVIRTRILHGIVRRRLMNTVKDGKYDFEKDGYPLNAEDMTATLGSFCIPPIVASLKIGSPMPLHLQAAYISHWRHVGYYLGVPSDILGRHFDVSRSLAPANKIFASLSTHLLAHPVDLEKCNRLPPPTLPLLHTAAGMEPFKTPLTHHFRAARYFLGDELATALDIPQSSPVQLTLMQLSFYAIIYPEYFGMYYPRRNWERTRMQLSQDLLGRMVRSGLKGRRSMFRPHRLVAGQGAKQEGELPDEVKQEEALGLKLDPVGAYTAVKKYRALMIEMVLVSGLSATVVGYSAYQLGSMLVGIVPGLVGRAWRL
ncbi:hypothetical protein QFC22_000559 [Naganishia vaughanmartiniae]|uniref:Uncharacterized protein n=1 Tax=Naganishia vaughanmartiniae TaxID=1424756 RepID=A0ACC2XSC4_9TREE|nr:hypothetical protein QFC22_000559 [Naganishia vaughanmartiniae]